MYARVNLAAAGSIALAVLAAHPAFAAPEDSDRALSRKALERRWVPAFAVTSGVLFQEQDSSVASECLLGGESVVIDPGPGGTNKEIASCNGVPPILGGVVGDADLRPAEEDHMWAVSPYVGANVQLMSPGLSSRYPLRIFLSGEMVANFATSRNIASEADPSGIRFPEGKNSAADFPSKAFLGIGSRTTSQLQTLSWGADLGFAAPLRFQGRQLLIKPSVGWIRFGMDIDGLVLAAVKDDWVSNQVNVNGTNYREISLSAEESKIFNAVGAGLELEMEAGRFGPIGASVFLNGHVYWVLGDRRVRLSDDTGLVRKDDFPTDDVLRVDQYSAEWRFNMEHRIYRAGLGIRFHWNGR